MDARLRGLVSVGIAVVLGGIAVGAYAAAAEIALEAELATEIQAPMEVNKAKDVEKWGPKIDEPSNGEFIWKPGKPATGGDGDHQGLARFVVQLPRADTYAIWGRVIAWDGNSDSFWVRVRPADPDENPAQTQNTQFRWGVAQGPNWHWDRINHWLDGGTFDRQWKLPKGEAEITIYTRETATMLDSLFITTEVSPDVGIVNPRTPTKEDIERQKRGGQLAVQPRGKLATTWARLRRR
jgi:hypothetical protein